MIRPHEVVGGQARATATRRTLLRVGFLSAAGVAATALLGALPSFMRVIKIEGLGGTVVAGPKAEILASFKARNDAPILNSAGRFFLIHHAGAIAAAYRKCVHLGCAVPFNVGEDQFHCVCHQSVYDKNTALKKSGPAPRGLDLFHVQLVNGALVVNTNPLEVMRRDDNRWHAEQVEVLDA
ncbi:MAG TPA: Rieske 2Fe-2S domain-containing protein [Candidatus Limnocylindrales bacterium]|nr:Rieske 2Fe-2S domain-containing protein [Candidatus Limnocylindrales bacterium]